MPDQHSEPPIAPDEPAVAPDEPPIAPAGAAPRRPRRRPRDDWRLGGRAVRRWDATVLAGALVGAGLGVVGGGIVARIPTVWAPVASTLVLWAGLAAAVAFAFVRARPAGLLRFRSLDLMWGLAFGLGLRLLQGAVSGAGADAFPSVATLDGHLPAWWWLTDALPAAFLAPVVEEFFFRAVVLVGVYQLLRRSLGSISAGVTALLVSTGAFVVLHASAGALSLVDGVVLFAVGATCSLLVLLTGRIWAAVLAHAVYNTVFVVLVLSGTALA